MKSSEASEPDLSAAFSVHRGVVDDFDERAGVGTVSDSVTGQRWYFHSTRIADGTRHIEVGRAVTFGVAPHPTGLEAVEVTPEA